MTKDNLNPEERDILESFERGEWQRTPKVADEIERHQQYARNTLRKDKRVNIRITSRDLDQLRSIAAEDGIPYQTLISSILHRYVSGRLIERRVSGRALEPTGSG